MPESMLARAALAVDLVKKAGAQEVFAWARRTRSVEFRFRDGALEKVQDATARSLSVEVYADGRYSAHTTTDLRDATLASFAAEAVALTRALEPDPHRRLPDPALYATAKADGLDLVDPAVTAIDEGRRRAWCEEMDARVRAHDRVVSVTSYATDDVGSVAGLSSNGFSGEEERTSVWLGVEATLEDEGDRRPEEYEWVGGPHLDGLPAPTAIADRALERALARLGAAPGSTRKTTLIVDPRAGGRLISSLLGPATAEAVQQSRSFWAGKTGQRMFSELLTITDEPLRPRGLASRSFDGEGLRARPLVLVEKGVARGIYADTYYGRKAGIAPTTGSASNREVALGDRPLADLVKSAGDAVYVTSWLGGNSDPNTGDFSFGMRGHLVVGGVVGPPVAEMNVTGNLADLFAHLVAVGNDPYPWSSTRTPTMVFEGVQMSGV